PPLSAQRAMPRIVTRPVIASIASATRRSRRMVVRSRHWLKQAKSTIISGMGGCSLCRVGLGNPYSTRYSTALFHLHTVLSRPVSSPFLAKVLSLIDTLYTHEPARFEAWLDALVRDDVRSISWWIGVCIPMFQKAI